MKSENLSFAGFELWTFIKGRKKTALTICAGICGYFIADSATVAAVSGGFIEMLYGLAEYWFKSFK